MKSNTRFTVLTAGLMLFNLRRECKSAPHELDNLIERVREMQGCGDANGSCSGASLYETMRAMPCPLCSNSVKIAEDLPATPLR